MVLTHQISGFPVNCPIIQFFESGFGTRKEELKIVFFFFLGGGGEIERGKHGGSSIRFGGFLEMFP